MRQTDTTFAATMLRWFRENGRELPWRMADPPSVEAHAYAVWLSEIILQQTRIQQGMDYWHRFMRRWPTVNDLAAATEDEVLREWQGLGYYSRARNLHHAAQQIVAQGHFPDTLEGIRRLKGVGDYTAAAIGSIVFGLPAAVVDGNVYRVLARYFGIDTPINTTEGRKLFAALAQEQLPPDQPSAFNQAMMDFGAIQCTPQSPRCLLCPLAEGCAALRTNRTALLPVKQKKLTVKTRRLAYIYIRCQGMTAIRRRPAGDIWQGLWEPVGIESGGVEGTGVRGCEGTVEGARARGNEGARILTSRNISRSLAPSRPRALEITPSRPRALELILLRSSVRHVLTHRIIVADFYLLEVGGREQLPADIQKQLEEQQFVWIREEEIANYAVPRLVELLLEAVNAHDEKQCPE